MSKNIKQKPQDPIKYLTERMLKFREDRDWKQFHTPKELAVAVSIEAAELLELMLWRTGKKLNTHLEKHREDLSDEIADVLNTLLLLAHDCNIDVLSACENKINKNEAKYPINKSKGKVSKYSELK